MPSTLNSVEEVVAALSRGEYHRLIGTVEGAWLDAKMSPYLLDTDSQKLELAKDVSAFANADGGVILLGFRTTREARVAGDRIFEVCPFALDLVDPDKYRKALGQRVYPPLDNVDVRLYPAGDSRNVAAVIIDSKLTVHKPFLVEKTLDETGRVDGRMLGFFERKRDQVPPISVERLHHLLASGLQLEPIYERLDSIDNAIRSLREPASVEQRRD